MKKNTINFMLPLTRLLKWIAFVLLPIVGMFICSCSENRDEDEPETPSSAVKFNLTLVLPDIDMTIYSPSAYDTTITGKFSSYFYNDASFRVLVRQNGAMINLDKSKIEILNDDGNEGKIEVDGSGQIDANKPYDIYVLGGSWRYDEDDVYYRTTMLRNKGFNSWLKCSNRDINTKKQMTCCGTIEYLYIINKSGAPIKFKHKGFDAEEKWYYSYAEVAIGSGKVTESEYGDVEGDVQEIPVYPTKKGRSCLSFYVPNGKKIQNAQLIAEINGKEVRSENRISSDIIPQLNHVYAMFAVWDGEKLTMGEENGESVVKIDLPEGTSISAENLTILGDGENININKDGTLSSKPANLIALNNNGEIVYLSYGCSNEERVLGSIETALALLLPTIPDVVTDFDSKHLQAFKVMVALLRPTYDLAQAIKESIVKYNCLNMDAIQPQLTAAVRELHHRCGLDKGSLAHARKVEFSPWYAKDSNDRPSYPYFKASNDRTFYYDFITVQMTDAQLKEKDGSKYWACMFDVYNDNRFCYTSFTKALKTAGKFSRYDDSWADTFRYLIKPYNLSEFMDLGLISDIAYDPEHFLTTLYDYDYSNILEDPLIARIWEPFAKDRITTFDKTVKRDIRIDFFTANEHLVVVGPGTDDNLLLFNIIKIGIQPLLKMYVKAESNSEDLDKFTEGFLKWISEADVNFRADLLQHFKDPSYSMWEKISYILEKLSNRIVKYVTDKLFDAASEVFIKRVFGNSGSLALKDYKKVMNALKTGYKVADIWEFLLDSQYRGYTIEIEHGYGETNGTLPTVPGSDF